MTELHVLRVFCDQQGRFGNPLGVVLDGGLVPEGDRQEVARKLGFSETVFVDDRATGALRIFTPATELRLAGHPLVGTSWLLAHVGGELPLLRPPAGDVRTAASPRGAWIEAHPSDAPPFVLEQHARPETVEELPIPEGADAEICAWAWEDEPAGRVRSRVFAGAVGIPEDEATGAAALVLCGHVDRPITIRQGEGSIVEAEPVLGGTVRVGGVVVLDETVELASRL